MEDQFKAVHLQELPPSSESGSSDSQDSEENINELCTAEDDETGWEEPLPVKAVCLFCNHEEVSGHNLVSDHLLQVHQLNLRDWILKFQMGHLQYIKMVNYFRKMNGILVPSEIIKSINTGLGSPPWRSDEYLSPEKDKDDPLLYLNFDEFVESDDDKDLEAVGVSCNDDNHFECNRVISMLRDVVHKIAGDENTAENSSKGVTRTTIADDLKHDRSGYFESYNSVDIHASMLKDLPRTLAYKAAIQEGTVCLGKSVLDVGCGTGILSMFAAQAGASHVCAIDRSDIIIETIDIIHENKFQDIIECVHGPVESLRREKFDVIVSEWMGYFLLYEGMLSSFLYARDNLLKSGGTLIPSQAAMYIAGFSDLDFRKLDLGMWDDVFGFKMSSMKRRALTEPQIMTVHADNVITNSFEILNLDLYHCGEEEAIIMEKFELTSNCSRPLTGIVGFFDVTLNNPSSADLIKLRTGPFNVPTHWKHCVFQLPEIIPLEKGQTITGNIQCKPSSVNERSLVVTILLHEPKMRVNYIMN